MSSQRAHNIVAQYSDSDISDLDEAEGNSLASSPEEVDNHAGLSQMSIDNKHLKVPKDHSSAPGSASSSPSLRMQSVDSLGIHKGSFSPEYEIDDDEDRPSSPISFHRTLEGLSPDEIVIPPEPKGQCSRELREKIAKYHARMLVGDDMIGTIERRKDFRNPSIYEKLIAYCDIDEFGSNYPPELYDPHKYGPESYYEKLNDKQKEEMDKYEKEKKDKIRVEVVTATVNRPKSVASSSSSDQKAKKSKWDDPKNSSNAALAAALSAIKKK